MNECNIRIDSKFYKYSSPFNCINMVQGRGRRICIFPELKSDGPSCLMFCMFPQTPNTPLVSRISCNWVFSEVSNLILKMKARSLHDFWGYSTIFYFM